MGAVSYLRNFSKTEDQWKINDWCPIRRCLSKAKLMDKFSLRWLHCFVELSKFAREKQIQLVVDGPSNHLADTSAA